MPCQCIAEDALQGFYDHGLGEDCLPGEPLPQCDQDAIAIFDQYNINKADDLNPTEWQIYFTQGYHGSLDRDSLFGSCDENNDSIISQDEFIWCNCQGPIHEE